MKQKRNLNKLLLLRYRKMSGEKKIRLGMQLAEMVRKVRKAGIAATGH